MGTMNFSSTNNNTKRFTAGNFLLYTVSPLILHIDILATIRKMNWWKKNNIEEEEDEATQRSHVEYIDVSVVYT